MIGDLQRLKLGSLACRGVTSVIHRLSQKILNFCMQMFGCKVALEQDLSIGTIFRLKKYLYVPLILSTRPNGLKLDLLLLVLSYQIELPFIFEGVSVITLPKMVPRT